MGIFTRFKQLFNKTISVLPHQRNDMVSFVKLKNGMIKIGSEIVVDENFNLVIVHFNKVCDVLRSGSYKVDEVNTPKLFKYSKAFVTKRGMFAPKTIKTDAYFINLKPFKLNNFKTPERIITYKHGEKIKIKLEGTFTLKVVDSERVMKALCNDYAVISNRKAMKEIKSTIGFDVSKILNAKEFELNDYLNNKEKITNVLNEEINKFISIYGLEAGEFFINAVILPKKNVVEKPKEEVLKQENNIDIVKLVEERLNSLENSFAKVEKPSSTENQFSNINSANTTINKQGDVRIDVSNIGNAENVSTNVFTMPYSNTPNTQMFNTNPQKEPQLFEETKEPENWQEEKHKEIKTNGEEKLKQKTEEEGEQNFAKKQNGKIEDMKDDFKEDEKVINEVVNYFVKQKRDFKENSLNNIDKYKVKISKQSPESIISFVNRKTKKCVHCGQIIDEDAKFCSKCGKSAEELIVCACCGAKNFPTAKTCCVCKSDL